MKRFIKYIGLLVIGVLILVNLISAFSLYMLRQGSFYKPTFLMNKVKTNAFDYVVLGASTGLTTLDTKIIDSISGKNGINLAIDDTGLSNHYLMLKHFIASGKTTKYCVVVPVVDAIDNVINYQGDNDYRFLMYVQKDYVSDYYNNLLPKRGFNVLKNSKWMPFLGVSYYNSELFFPSLVSIMNPNKRNRFDEKGNYTYPTSSLALGIIDKKEKYIGFKNAYLNKIEDLCYANNVKVIYYLTPDRTRTVVHDKINQAIVNHSNIFENNLYFYDDIHVNKLGNRKASELFAIELKAMTEK